MPPSADNIATFVEVVRRQSLSAAARSLGLPKSTVSRRLGRLEDELHDKLLLRDARKITLTATGQRFYAAVVAAVDALDAALLSLEQNSQQPRGTIRITVPPDLGRMLLAPIFVAFLEQQPEISLDVMFTNRLVDLVQEGVDLAVRASRVLKGDLIARKLCDSGLQLAVAAKHAALTAKSADIRTLERGAFVLYRAEAGRQTIKLERSAAGKGPKQVELDVSGHINVDDYAAMAELVATGDCVGLMPAIHVQDGVQNGRLVRLYPEWSSRSGHVYLLYASRQQPARVRLLTEFLIAAFSKLDSV
jgi:DNA-binding transcriptional LysR family regulator